MCLDNQTLDNNLAFMAWYLYMLILSKSYNALTLACLNGQKWGEKNNLATVYMFFFSHTQIPMEWNKLLWTIVLHGYPILPLVSNQHVHDLLPLQKHMFLALDNGDEIYLF